MDQFNQAYQAAQKSLPSLQAALPELDILVEIGLFRTGDMGPDGKPTEWPAASRREVRVIFREKQ